MSDIDLVSFKACPKCHLENSPDALECTECGVVFDRYGPSDLAPNPGQPQKQASEPKQAPKRVTFSFPSPRWLLLFAGASVIAFFVWRPSYLFVGPPAEEGQQGLILLHDLDSEADDLVRFASQISASAPEVSILLLTAPHGTVKGRAWHTGGGADSSLWQLTQSEEAITRAIEYLEKRGIPSSEIFLGGVGHGAEMALHAATYTDLERKIGGVVLVKGSMPHWQPTLNEDSIRRTNFSDDFRVLLVTRDLSFDQSEKILRDVVEFVRIESGFGPGLSRETLAEIGGFFSGSE